MSARSRELHCDNVSVCWRCSGSMWFMVQKKYVIFALKCMNSGQKNTTSSGQKNTTGIIVLFNFVPFILYRSILFCSQACHGIVLNSSEQICMARNFLNATCFVEVTHPWRLWTFCGLCFICWRECLCEWCMRPRHSRRPLPWKFDCRGIARWCKMVLPSCWVFCFWALLNYFFVDAFSL